MEPEKDKSIVEELSELPINHFIFAVEEARKNQHAKLDRFVADMVAADIQKHIDANGWKRPCPKCGSVIVLKNGKRGNIQRYKCGECGFRFTSVSGTVLEKTRYTWAVWVEVIKGMLNGLSVPATQHILEDDYKCVGIEANTVWLMRMKVMYAVSKIPSPVLSGVVSFDDTFFREDQKASRTLVDPLPADISEGREPRYGRVMSQMGPLGGEFVTVTCAKDNSGKCVCRVLAQGYVPTELYGEFVLEHTRDLSYAVTDAASGFKEVFRDLGVPHYICPSDYRDKMAAAGYETPSRRDPEKRIRQIERNDKILERLWKEGEIYRIANRGYMTWNEFKRIKKDNHLTINSINSLHRALKSRIDGAMRGVSSRWLPYYVAFFEYTWNLKGGMDCDGNAPVCSSKDAEDILLAVLETGENLTSADIARIRSEPLGYPKPSGRYVHELKRKTEMMKKLTRDDLWRFEEEDGIESFEVAKILDTLSTTRLKELARACGLHDWRNRNRTMLRIGLSKMDEVEGILFATVIADAKRRHEKAEREAAVRRVERQAREAATPRRRKTSKSIIPKRCFTPLDGAVRPLFFLDVETTGLRYGDDEILSISLVSEGGDVVYDRMFKPYRKASWPQAQEVNGISPEDVAGCPRLGDEKATVDELLGRCPAIAGWNIGFDLRMLFANGIEVPRGDFRYVELSGEFGGAWARKLHIAKSKARYTLEEAAGKLGLAYAAHTSLGDASVLIPIVRWIETGETGVEPDGGEGVYLDDDDQPM